MVRSSRLCQATKGVDRASVCNRECTTTAYYYSPPSTPALCPTSKQVREYFRFGTRQCKELVERHAHDIIHAPIEERVEPIKVVPCMGITLVDVLAVKTDKERLDMLEEGYSDMVEEAMTNSAVLLRKSRKTWGNRLRFPSRGPILTGKEDEVRWMLLEGDPAEGEEDADLFDLVSFRVDTCTGEDSVHGSNLCEHCFCSKRAFIRRCFSTYDLRTKPFNPSTNNRFLRTTSLLGNKILAVQYNLVSPSSFL